MPSVTRSAAVSPSVTSQISAIRRFNRFYTKQIGVLRHGYLNSPFSLSQVRVLYELARCEKPLANSIAHNLGMDAGQLSRILRDFVRRGLLVKKRPASDGRQRLLALTVTGRKSFAQLDRRADKQASRMLRVLPSSDRSRLIGAMNTVENLLAPPAKSQSDVRGAPQYILRTHRSGDMGWIVHRHGALYFQEYGYDEQFEALVARIVADFIRKFDSKRERCWVAERDGAIVGSVFLVKKSKVAAKLRLLYVEPGARGLGIGRRLVDECVRFARESGYKKITLWTQSHLDAARHIYKNAGFRLVHSEPHHSFSLDLVAQTWNLDL